MEQYRTMPHFEIINKDGTKVRAKGFRQRVKYSDDNIFLDKMKQSNLLRPDILSNDKYGSIYNIGGIIDTNEKDIFSFDLSEQFRYANPNLLY